MIKRVSILDDSAGVRRGRRIRSLERRLRALRKQAEYERQRLDLLKHQMDQARTAAQRLKGAKRGLMAYFSGDRDQMGRRAEDALHSAEKAYSRFAGRYEQSQRKVVEAEAQLAALHALEVTDLSGTPLTGREQREVERQRRQSARASMSVSSPEQVLREARVLVDELRHQLNRLEQTPALRISMQRLVTDLGVSDTGLHPVLTVLGASLDRLLVGLARIMPGGTALLLGEQRVLDRVREQAISIRRTQAQLGELLLQIDTIAGKSGGARPTWLVQFAAEKFYVLDQSKRGANLLSQIADQYGAVSRLRAQSRVVDRYLQHLAAQKSA